jgi:LmbE family N-acetylglucosaminyl deacetylase
MESIEKGYNKMRKKIMFIAVHPDDETLGCGGTILRHKTDEDEIYWLILTEPTVRHYSQEFVNKRKTLLPKISKEYGFNDFYFLGFPAQRLHAIDMQEFIVKIDYVINKIQPNIIYVMFNNDVHSDHRIAFEAVYSCTKSFRKPYINTIYMYETLSETEFAPALQSTSFVPNVYIDITPYMQKKLEIMAMYDTELMQEPYPRSLGSIEALARFRGSRCGVKYAEAFMLLYHYCPTEI